MRLPFHIFCLGWWLAGQWGMSSEQNLPKPSISVSPSPVVVLGGAVNILCKSEHYQQMEFYLMKGKTVHAVRLAEFYDVVFPILNATTKDGGIYWCLYHHRTEQTQWSAESDKVYINITDPSLSKPSIKLHGEPALGMKVTIECQGPQPGLMFSLHKSRSLTAIRVLQPDGYAAYFHFLIVSLADAASYTCRYNHGRKQFVWSEPSDPVEIVLQDHASVATNVRLGAGILVLLVLLLIMAEAVYSWSGGQL